jgi:peroxiredoxin
VAVQPVSQTVCGYSDFPVLSGVDIEAEGTVPMVALTQPGPNGMIEVSGHARARTSRGSGGAPNLIVHFAGDAGAANLASLTRALSESGRTDAPTAVVAVVDGNQLRSAKYTPGVVYAEKGDGEWEKAFGVKDVRGPVTLIVGPDREIRWRYEGEVDNRMLAEALRKSLVKSGPVRLGLMRSSVRIGHPPPNFIFEYAPGQAITLRKLAGQPVTLVFYKDSSKASIEAVQSQRQRRSDASSVQPVVLAIHDGGDAEAARKGGSDYDLPATVVPDPKRAIAAAYGVSVWPTIVSIDEGGLVVGIRYGSISEDRLPYPTEQRSAE